jgi:hypothetical protein
MTAPVPIRFFDFTGGPFGVTAENGKRGHDGALLDRAPRNAKAYYANPKAFDDAWQPEIGDDATACVSSGQAGV